MFFFFSSRRRHTRLQGDWSSDVCSSDLKSGWGRGPRRIRRGEKEKQPKRRGASERPRTRIQHPRRGRGTTLWRGRSEERRVGKEGRARWGGDQGKKRMCGETR